MNLGNSFTCCILNQSINQCIYKQRGYIDVNLVKNVTIKYFQITTLEGGGGGYRLIDRRI